MPYTIRMKGPAVGRQRLAAPAAALICVIHAVAQTGTSPTPDDPVLYLLLLSRQDEVCREIDTVRAKDADRAHAIQRAAAAQVHLSTEDFPKLCPVRRRLAAKFEIIDAEADAYRDSVVAGKVKLDPAKVQSFSDRRNQALSVAISELQQSLGPAAWSELKAYVEGAFRKNIAVGRVSQ
jgi:hypothetical protein